MYEDRAVGDITGTSDANVVGTLADDDSGAAHEEGGRDDEPTADFDSRPFEVIGCRTDVVATDNVDCGVALPLPVVSVKTHCSCTRLLDC